MSERRKASREGVDEGGDMCEGGVESPEARSVRKSETRYALGDIHRCYVLTERDCTNRPNELLRLGGLAI